MPTPDIDRLNHLVDWAEAEDAKRLAGQPSHWDQTEWFDETDCGTACCVAGKVALEDGAEVDSLLLGYISFPGSRQFPVSEYAQQALGLTEDQADALFHSGNTVDSLRKIVAAIVDGVDDWDVLSDLIEEF